MGRNAEDDSPGVTCKYRLVMASELWPRVFDTREIEAPRPIAWVAWLCRNQWGETCPVSYTHLTLPTNREV